MNLLDAVRRMRAGISCKVRWWRSIGEINAARDVTKTNTYHPADIPHA